MQQLHAGSYPHIQQNTHGGEFAGGGGGLPILLPSHQAVATTSPLSGFKPAAVVPTSPHLAGAAGACRPPTAMPSAAHLTQQHHSSALIDENRHRYHVYERESTWAEVEKLSGYISRYAVAEAASPTDISKEKYYDLFNIGVHLLKAIETLDPDRSVSPKTEQQFGGSSTMSSPLQRPLGQAGFHGTHPAMAPLPSTHAGTSPPPFPQARSMSPHTFSPNPDSLPSFLSRGYTSEPGGARASSKVPPPAPAPIGIARYNQSIVSGMLSMGQPPMGVSPSPKQLPVEPEHHQQGLSQEGQMSAEAGESNSSGGSRKKRRRKVQRRDLHCHVCGVVDTPEWRRGPDGDHTLCNACGLHYAKALKKEKEAREKEGRKHSIDMLLNNQQGRENARGAVESSNSSLDLNC